MFDLEGPRIGIKVERDGVTLPISQVPNLRAGDRIWVHPDFPDHQSAHYLLIVSFLRGSTNPPPEKWFTRAETWSKKVREEGIFVIVPEEAEQAVIFLAPETGGDFNTLRSAVRGRPGSFVRAVQDLDQASLDRARLDTYLDAIRKTSESDPSQVHAVSVLLARSLNIRLEDDCFKKPIDEQATCLTQKGGDLVLNDGHSQSVVGAITNGAPSDLIGQLSYTAQAASGYFSPYVGAIIDLGRILDSLHTAQYQYIPALSLPNGDALELKLNNPPSFHNPKSVIVIALPAVRKEEPPPLRAADALMPVCLQKNPLVLPSDGAPLAFSTDLAHDMSLRVQTTDGKAVELPVKANAARGGFVVDQAALANLRLGDGPSGSLKGALHGSWGFESFHGPDFELHYSKESKWTIPNSEVSGLTAGAGHTLHLTSSAASCVDHVVLKDETGRELKTQWKVAKADEVEVTIPVESAKNSGSAHLLVKLAGVAKDESIDLHFYGEPAQLRLFTIIPGDSHGLLHGKQLNDVESVELGGIRFARDEDRGSKAGSSGEELQLAAQGTIATASLHANDQLTAHAKLKDGRSVDVRALIESPRPRVSLLSKAVEMGPASQASRIHLSNENELPLDGRLSFSLRTEMPETFPRNEKIEIATTDYSFHVLLSIDDGGLTLQDSRTIVGRFDPSKCFGSSAFGPLRFRAVDERGVNGDWEPLSTLVREPSLKELTCPENPSEPCLLKGGNLFLLDQVGVDPEFSEAAAVPQGFVAASLRVPHPINGTLYLRLRDDPSDVNTATLPLSPADPQPETPIVGPPN
jgi:hypothetical protein